MSELPLIRHTRWNGDMAFGLGERQYLEDERSDGFRMVEGQEIILQDIQGRDAAADAVGVTDPRMPIRFAVKVDPNTYYRVKVVLTGADPGRDALISLFAEKRHFHLIEKLIPAGEQLTYEFSAACAGHLFQTDRCLWIRC